MQHTLRLVLVASSLHYELCLRFFVTNRKTDGQMQSDVYMIHCAKLICIHNDVRYSRSCPCDTPKIYRFRNNNFLKIPGNIARYLVRTNSTH